MKIWKAFVVTGLMATGSSALASDLENLAKQGYGVLIETTVNGEFKGCEFGRRIPLQNGMVFVCESYNYHYAYSPEVLILKSVRDGSIRVVIDDDQFDGTVYKR